LLEPSAAVVGQIPLPVRRKEDGGGPFPEAGWKKFLEGEGKDRKAVFAEGMPPLGKLLGADAADGDQ
jgi:hypothetical protein